MSDSAEFDENYIYDDGYRDGYIRGNKERHVFVRPRTYLFTVGIVIFALLMMYGKIINVAGKVGVDKARQLLNVEIEKLPSYTEFRSISGSKVLIYWANTSQFPLENKNMIKIGNVDFFKERK